MSHERAFGFHLNYDLKLAEVAAGSPINCVANRLRYREPGRKQDIP
jgi:hypothetical protein